MPPTAALGSRIRVSVTPCGFRGGRKRSLGRFFSGFLPFSPAQISFHHLIHFISPNDGVTGVVARYLCKSHSFNIELSSHLPRPGPVLRRIHFYSCFFFEKKKTKRLIKWAAGVCVSVCVCVCVCVCMCVCTILVPPNNFQTNYPIDTKFWLHTVSYRNSPMPLISFLNFENCARENFFEIHFFSI